MIATNSMGNAVEIFLNAASRISSTDFLQSSEEQPMLFRDGSAPFGQMFNREKTVVLTSGVSAREQARPRTDRSGRFISAVTILNARVYYFPDSVISVL